MTIIALDLETTGLLSPNDDIDSQPHIIEIGAIKFDAINHETIASISQLLDPGIQISERITEITGIKNQELHGKPTFAKHFKHLTKFFVGCSTILTFNGESFDLEVLRFELLRIGMLLRFPWPPLRIDLMLATNDYMAMKGKSGNKFPKLVELYIKLFDEDFANQHRAIADAEATMKCYMELKKRKIL
jgi:DNA polymerase III epsilon subunit-like protein